MPNKARLDLLPTKALEETAGAFAEGGEKYGEWAWRNGSPWRAKQAAAMLRHIAKWMQGEDIDKDSGVHHLAHANSRGMILIEFYKDKRYRGFDDRKKASRGPTRKPK